MSVLEDGEGKRLLGVCSPPDSTTMDFVQIFVRSAQNKKLRTAGNAAAFALPGFAQAFPCTADLIKRHVIDGELRAGTA